MVDILLYLFIVLCLALIAAIVVKPMLILEYPYFMGGIFTIFILPQAVGLFNNPEIVPDGALDYLYLACILCIIMSWIGYQGVPNRSVLAFINVSVDKDRFFQTGVFFVLAGYYFELQVNAVAAIQEVGTQWTGIITIYAFFANLVYIGFAICLQSALERPRFIAIAAAVFAATSPLSIVLLYGRRTPAVLFSLYLVLNLFYIKNFRIPRIAVIGVLFFAMIFIPSTGTYRAYAAAEGWQAAFERIDFVDTFKKYIKSPDVPELRNAAHVIHYYLDEGEYEWGAAYWNEIIFRYIPAQFVGAETKEALMVGSRTVANVDYETYTISTGSTMTGIADSFIQFGYLGCFFFFLMGRFFRNLWAASLMPKSDVLRIFYAPAISSALTAVTHQSVNFLPSIFFNLIFLWLATLYSRKPNSVPAYA
jgi:hypothetical protein